MLFKKKKKVLSISKSPSEDNLQSSGLFSSKPLKETIVEQLKKGMLFNLNAKKQEVYDNL